ncbi:MAG TPA: alkaline phosphatase family protein [Gaiellaceae bacterium]|nr:alkaline phosphatase family protein [Gaiellaceae bacterium]
MTAVEVNGRSYSFPATKTAVVCLDGVDPRYLDDAFERKLVPRLRELVEQGVYATASSQLPSFTNPNNLSIVTGAPPAVHGVPGNHYLAPDGREVQLTDAAALRAPSIHATFEKSGVSVLAVTTKDKLRGLLGAGAVPCVSAERAGELELSGHGRVSRFVDRPVPGIYDWDCSHYALELGLALSDLLEVELLYVSLTDFVQHAAAPGEELSDAYLSRLDELVGSYLDGGWRLGLVADHGMNAKPRVRYLGDVLQSAGVTSAHVVLPITDPYVVHHAALGSACWIHVEEDELESARAVLETVDGVEEVLTRDEAAAALALPADRIGDLVVLADAETALGRNGAEHDLSALRGPLRSHGGRHEQAVPILLSERPDGARRELLERGAANADVHFLLLGEGT